MTGADKTKLNGIAAGANNYAFRVADGTPTVQFDILNGETLSLKASTNMTISFQDNGGNNRQVIFESTDTNNFLTGVSGSGNGTVTFTRSGLSNLTWNAAHNHSAAHINSGTLPVARGGTGATSLTGVVIGNGTGAMTSVATLSVNRGGTGRATFASDYILFGNGTSGINTSIGIQWVSGRNALAINSDTNGGFGNQAELEVWNGGQIGTGVSIWAQEDIVAFSDKSVKTNIRGIDNVIERIQNSRGVIYDRTDTDSKDNIGFIAQELEENFPELVFTNESGLKSVKYQNAVAVLFEAIKEQQKQINELKELLKK
jgi:hypothetical protein